MSVLAIVCIRQWRSAMFAQDKPSVAPSARRRREHSVCIISFIHINKCLSTNENNVTDLGAVRARC